MLPPPLPYPTVTDPMPHHWIADRTRCFDASGIRKVFDLGAKLSDPINLSIGQPDFDVPEAVRRAAIEAIEQGKNGYALSQGMPVLREPLLERVRQQYGQADRDLFVTSGTSGGLMLALLVLVNPGDEVIVFDPYFVMYDALTGVAGGRAVYVETYPDFRIDLDRVAAAITPRTKAILFNSPANPTGAVPNEATVRALARLAAERDLVLISDEIYNEFCYEPFISPAAFYDGTLVVDGFSKSYGMPGWRVGFAHGPREIIQEMIKLQQYSFVCAPHPFQWAAAAALELDMGAEIEAYRRKRDLVVEGLGDVMEIEPPGGAFYVFPKAPWGTGAEFVESAIAQGVLVIPGKVFSRRDTHFRISYAAKDETIERGVEVLRRLARRGPSHGG
jgi:aspartate/methionine/tyrosine aminotransferase